jgi:hypothetical protein
VNVRRRILHVRSIFLISVVALAVLVPACDPEQLEEEPQQLPMAVLVQAQLDNVEWTGPLDFTLVLPEQGGPTVFNGTQVPTYAYFSPGPGNWTCNYISGGPPGAILTEIWPALSAPVPFNWAQPDPNWQTFSIDFVFETPPPPPDGPVVMIQVRAWLDGVYWPGALEFDLHYTPPPGPPQTMFPSSVPNITYWDLWPGNYTVVYQSGGPPGADLINAAQTVQLPDNLDPQQIAYIDFDFWFETPPPPPLDASIVFSNWMIDQTPVDPAGGPYNVSPGDFISLEYNIYVTGEQGKAVNVKRESWLLAHNTGYHGDEAGPSVGLHVDLYPLADNLDPSPQSGSSINLTMYGTPISFWDEIEFPWCHEVALVLETQRELKIGTNYTNTIDWIGFAGNGVGALGHVVWTVLNVTEIDTFEVLTLTPYACVEVEGDENPDNDCASASPPLSVIFLLEQLIR